MDRRVASEAPELDSWTRDEVTRLLSLAREFEPRRQPALSIVLSAEMRRGELLGLQCRDIDFERCRIHVRRAWAKGAMTRPTNGRGRHIAMSPGLASMLIDLLAIRRRESVAYGWP